MGWGRIYGRGLIFHCVKSVQIRSYFWSVFSFIIINESDYSNPYDESNDNRTKIKELLTKIIKVLLSCVVIKTIIIEIIQILMTIMVIIVIIIINNSNMKKIL